MRGPAAVEFPESYSASAFQPDACVNGIDTLVREFTVVAFYMTEEQLQAFTSFVATHRKSLSRIAWKTKKEYQREDVESEAWLIAKEMHNHADGTFDLADPAAQDQLLARLYARLVKFSEKNIRYAVRLDQSHDDDDGASHPLLRKLASPEENNP